jgi:hypothetical protein
MRTLYKVLGLPQGASHAEVKAAFRALARRLHPDLNGGDAKAEQKFKEVNQAYETLADPEARAAYDRALVCQAEERRRHWWMLSATAAASFAATSSAILLGTWLLWSGSPAHQVEAQAPSGRDVSVLPPIHHDRPGHLLQVADTAQIPRKGATWTTYRNARFRFGLKYPADLFAFDRGPANDNVRTLASRDGEAVLRIFAADNSTGATVARYRRSRIEERYAGAVIDHSQQHKNGYEVSGVHGDKAFYERVTFSCDGKSIHGWQVVFPVQERTVYDLVVDEVQRHYLQATKPGARCNDRSRSS